MTRRVYFIAAASYPDPDSPGIEDARIAALRDPPTLTRAQAILLRDMADGYIKLVGGQEATECAVSRVREIRARVKEQRRKTLT